MTKLVAVLVTAILAVPAGAATADPFVKSQAAFHYDDLDLASSDGQARLATRLDRVAGDVCGRGMDRVHPTLAQQAAACRKEVIAEAHASIDAQVAQRAQAQRVAMK